MSKYDEKVISCLKEKSILKAKDLKEIGLSSSQIQNMVNNDLIKRVNRGLYSLSDSLDDPYYELQLRFSKLIFSHETALSLHDLTDVTPSCYFATVPRNYNYQHIENETMINVVRVSKDRYGVGLEKILSPYGNMIVVTDKERTLCDVLTRRNRIDARVINEAYRNYFNRVDKDINKLVRYAKIFKVDKQVRNYMEILL